MCALAANSIQVSIVVPAPRIRATIKGQPRRGTRKRVTSDLGATIADFRLQSSLERATDEGAALRCERAQDPRASASELALLALDPVVEVRLQVADNPRTPADVLALLAGDAEMIVRSFVACHENTSAEVLARLAQDEEPQVCIAVATNPQSYPRLPLAN